MGTAGRARLPGRVAVSAVFRDPASAVS